MQNNELYVTCTSRLEIMHLISKESISKEVNAYRIKT